MSIITEPIPTITFIYPSEQLYQGDPLDELELKALRPVDPYVVERAFLLYCERKGWLEKVGEGRLASYYVTKEGREALKEFDIRI
ncbi:MAG: hypothetical protein ACMUHM_09085 [Thermoplasmatota archaeon]